MSTVHIRDYLAVTRKQMEQGKVSTRSMCGQQDPQMNTLAFGDPKQVVKEKVKNYCRECRGKWISEQEAVGDQARALHKFRKLMGKINNFNHFRSKGHR